MILQEMNVGEIPGYSLREHQLAMLAMLREIHRICQKHGIQYMLFAGSALGAVRHRGFIPWDDDLDIIMMRKDYENFLRLAPAELDQTLYYLQGEFSPHWPMFCSKLRKHNTTCLERFVPRDRQTHQGIYVDIFPCDNLADSGLLGRIQFYASKVVIAKALDRRGYRTDSRLKKVMLALCRPLPMGPFLALTRGERWGNSQKVHCFLGAASRFEKSVFPRQWMTECIDLPFEDGTAPVSRHYDAMLATLYGDYMTPPPEGERACKVHAALVDLNTPYQHYLEMQQTMHFEGYARSIR